MRDGWLSWPCWLTDSRRLNHKVVTHPASSLVQDRESSPTETSVLTTMLRHKWLAQGRYPKARQSAVKPATCWSQVQQTLNSTSSSRSFFIVAGQCKLSKSKKIKDYCASVVFIFFAFRWFALSTNDKERSAFWSSVYHSITDDRNFITISVDVTGNHRRMPGSGNVVTRIVLSTYIIWITAHHHWSPFMYFTPPPANVAFLIK